MPLGHWREAEDVGMSTCSQSERGE